MFDTIIYRYDAVSHSLDNNGNTLTSTTGSNTTTYPCDFEKRLTSVTLPRSVCL